MGSFGRKNTELIKLLKGESMKSIRIAFPYRMMIVLFVALITAGGCASKEIQHDKNISDAEMAIKIAKENNASTTAPLDIAIAEGKLQEARKAFDQKDYVTSQRLADEALVTATLAQAKSKNQRIKSMVDELRESIETLQNEINRNQKTK